MILACIISFIVGGSCGAVAMAFLISAYRGDE